MSTAEIDSDLTSENPVIINNNDSNENMEENYSSIGNNTKYADEKRDEFEEDLEEDNNVTSEGDNEEGDNEEEDNNVTSEGDNEEEDLEEDDEEEDLEEDDEEEVLTLSDDTEVYILCKDNIALCYFGTKNLAVETMWKIARQDKGKFMDSFTVFIKENDEDSIDIVGYHKFLVFSYERVFSTFTILPVKSVATTMYETKEVSHEATQEVASPMDDVQKVSQEDTQEVESTMDTTTRSRWWG